MRYTTIFILICSMDSKLLGFLRITFVTSIMLVIYGHEQFVYYNLLKYYNNMIKM